jgi:hypothetical protein
MLLHLGSLYRFVVHLDPGIVRIIVLLKINVSFQR